MKLVQTAVGFLLVTIAITLSGCGSSADSIASDLVDLQKKAKSDTANAQEYASRIQELNTKLEGELSKMSAEEKVEFMQKWAPKFMEAAFEGLGRFPAGNMSSDNLLPSESAKMPSVPVPTTESNAGPSVPNVLPSDASQLPSVPDVLPSDASKIPSIPGVSP